MFVTCFKHEVTKIKRPNASFMGQSQYYYSFCAHLKTGKCDALCENHVLTSRLFSGDTKFKSVNHGHGLSIEKFGIISFQAWPLLGVKIFCSLDLYFVGLNSSQEVGFCGRIGCNILYRNITIHDWWQIFVFIVWNVLCHKLSREISIKVVMALESKFFFSLRFYSFRDFSLKFYIF